MKSEPFPVKLLRRLIPAGATGHDCYISSPLQEVLV